MSKYELTISTGYAMSWTLADAVRELFQNAIDQEQVQSDNELFFEYTGDKLLIGNKKSLLSISSLLLGETTKAVDDRTIGKFGEGYKIATLVLLRLGKTITFYNYGAKEVWRPRFVNSKRYGAKVLTFFVDKKHAWEKVPDNNLTIEIDNISAAEYEEVYTRTLRLHEGYTFIAAKKGNVLLDEQYAGKVFINGLYVCKHSKYTYGYDFKPAYIHIDRDRKLVSDFDLQWLSSELWADIDSHDDTLVQLLKKDAPDVRYISNTSNIFNTCDKAVDKRNLAYSAFFEEHGDKAVPVTSQYDAEQVPKSYKPVIVAEAYKTLIIESDKYVKPVPDEEEVGPVERLEALLDAIRHKLTGDEIAMFERTIDTLNSCEIILPQQI